MMTIEKEKVTLTLPKTLINAVRAHTSPRGHSKFIAEAIQYYLDKLHQEALEAQLIAGYQANSSRDLAVSQEWEGIEEEAWSAMDATAGER